MHTPSYPRGRFRLLKSAPLSLALFTAGTLNIGLALPSAWAHATAPQPAINQNAICLTMQHPSARPRAPTTDPHERPRRPPA